MKIDIRNANINDLKLYYQWRNDPDVRSKSFHSNGISFENHSKWYKSKLKNDSTFMYVFETTNIAIGQVRIEAERNGAVIGISIDSNYRSMGLGSNMLKIAVEKFFKSYKTPIFAYIKIDNIASIKVFEKAGFKLICKNVINKIECYKYQILNENK